MCKCLKFMSVHHNTEIENCSICTQKVSDLQKKVILFKGEKLQEEPQGEKEAQIMYFVRAWTCAIDNVYYPATAFSESEEKMQLARKCYQMHR